MGAKPRGLLVGFFTILFIMSYFVLLAVVAAVIAAASYAGGFDPLRLGASLLFLLVVVAELTVLFLFDKPTPILMAMSTPFIFSLIVANQAINSEAIRRTIRQLTERIRTPPFVPRSMVR
jgi:hypothetical protein